MNIFQLYFNKQRLLLEALTTTKSLFLALIITIFTWVLFFTYVYFSRTAQESVIELATPPQTNKVKLFLELKSFPKFDINKDEFNADAHISFDYDPTVYAPEDFSGFRLYNGKILSKSAAVIEPVGTVMRATYDITFTFKGYINYIDFPFDKHRIDIIFTDLINKHKNRYFDNNNISLIFDSPTLGPGWDLSHTKITSGLTNIVGDKSESNNYQVFFSLYTHRASPKTAILVLMPLILLFFLQLISLTFEVTKDFSVILSLSVGSVSGFLFYRNVMERLMPITDDFTIADKVYLYLMLYNIFILGIQIYILHYFRKLQSQTTLTQLLDRAVNNIDILRGCIFIFCLIALLVSTFFILW